MKDHVRDRISTDTTTGRVHIANERAVQPLGFIGLAIEDSSIHVQELGFNWAKRVKNYLKLAPEHIILRI